MKRCKLLCILVPIVILCVACGKNTDVPENTPTLEPTESVDDVVEEILPAGKEEQAPTLEKIPTPTTNEELFEFIIEKWRNNEADDLYEYAGKDLQAVMVKEDFAGIFENISLIGGELLGVSDVELSMTTYTSVVEFENLTLDLQVSIRDIQISGFYYDIHFKDIFEIKHENGVVEKGFVFRNDGYELNAVYTYLDDGEVHPAVLFIAGSGPSDYNETIGLLTPFQDIAWGLASRGVNSLRLDKRTLRVTGEEWIGLEEEYYADCRAAIAFLMEQDISNLYLLGHSLGGQIATQLAAEDSEIDGMILFNSTPRHLADVACDQYVAAAPYNEELYTAIAESAKSLKEEDIRGAHYFGGDDYYWVSYNQLNTIANINEAGTGTLIINSTYDNQIFQTDIDMWNAELAGKDNVTIHIYDDISHYGYKIDTKDATVIYQKADFPEELLEEFAAFCE